MRTRGSCQRSQFLGFTIHLRAVRRGRFREGTADTLREALEKWREKGVSYGFLESLTNIEESAGFYRSDGWGKDPELYLRIVREHIELARDQAAQKREPAPTVLLRIALRAPLFIHLLPTAERNMPRCRQL